MESKIFYLKMEGDYYRYLAEFLINNEYQRVVDLGLQVYKVLSSVSRTRSRSRRPTWRRRTRSVWDWTSTSQSFTTRSSSSTNTLFRLQKEFEFPYLGLRRVHRKHRQRQRGELQRLRTHHAVAQGQPHALAERPGRRRTK